MFALCDGAWPTLHAAISENDCEMDLQPAMMRLKDLVISWASGGGRWEVGGGGGEGEEASGLESVLGKP